MNERKKYVDAIDLTELQDEQVCPNCLHVMEDHQSNWDDDYDEVVCPRCDKPYQVKSVYKHEGFQIERKCKSCGEWTEDGYTTCNCDVEPPLG